MKNLFVALFVFGFALTSFADIQDPPVNDYGPTRVGRGLSNMVFGWSLPSHRNVSDEGNSAAEAWRGPWSWPGLRSFGTGLQSVLWPIPTSRNLFPVLWSDIPWIHGGYQEFRPSLKRVEAILRAHYNRRARRGSVE
jgi:hypothetical protein